MGELGNHLAINLPFHGRYQRFHRVHRHPPPRAEFRLVPIEDDVAVLLGVSRRTVTRDWRAARAWLRVELAGG